MASDIPDAVRDAALFFRTRFPAPPEGSVSAKIPKAGWSILVGPGPGFGVVGVEALAFDETEEVVAEARRVLRNHGKTRGIWFIPEACTPVGLANELQRLGFVPFAEAPGDEPRAAVMVATEPPPQGPVDVTAREAQTQEEFRAGRAVVQGAFEFSEEDQRALDDASAAAWELMEKGVAPNRTFVAIVGGEVVGCGVAVYGDVTVQLIGGSTREDMRGRGIYRSLVRARWEAAAERGTPALTVEAASTSRPILEQLGFATIGWVDTLLDQFN